MSWKPEFKVDGDWCRNGQAFATRDEAERSCDIMEKVLKSL